MKIDLSSKTKNTLKYVLLSILLICYFSNKSFAIFDDNPSSTLFFKSKNGSFTLFDSIVVINLSDVKYWQDTTNSKISTKTIVDSLIYKSPSRSSINLKYTFYKADLYDLAPELFIHKYKNSSFQLIIFQKGEIIHNATYQSVSTFDILELDIKDKKLSVDFHKIKIPVNQSHTISLLIIAILIIVIFKIYLQSLIINADSRNGFVYLTLGLNIFYLIIITLTEYFEIYIFRILFPLFVVLLDLIVYINIYSKTVKTKIIVNRVLLSNCLAFIAWAIFLILNLLFFQL